jgi:TrpR-related protein YerC/YecD
MNEVNWNIKENKQLIKAILALRNADEAERFVRDLLTPAEIKEFANRLEAAALLSTETKYDYITDATGLSSTTIARIQKWLRGTLGGYRLVLPRISHHHNRSKLRKGLSFS